MAEIDDVVYRLKSMLEATRQSMEIVRVYQICGHGDSANVKRSDATLVTRVDHESGTAMKKCLYEDFPDTPYRIEDVGSDTGRTGYVFLGDPLDGTRAFVNGLATSTVILGLYSLERCQVVACVIGESATGRIWITSNFSEPKLIIEDTDVSRGFHVNDTPLGEQATVLIDVNHGFKRDGRQILLDADVARLFQRLGEYPAKVLMPGSNGLNHALVANGGERLVGAITTAIGGPWDVCGAHLVLTAGGAAKAYRLLPDRRLEEKDSLDVLSYDLLVAGNSASTVESLSEILKNAVL